MQTILCNLHNNNMAGWLFLVLVYRWGSWGFSYCYPGKHLRSWGPGFYTCMRISDWGIDLDYRDIEWFALEMNRNHSVVFEIASKYCILDSFVDYEGYSIFSKGFLPTVVDIMVIWVKFVHSSLLVHWFLKCQCSLLPSPVWPLPIYLDSWT